MDGVSGRERKHSFVRRSSQLGWEVVLLLSCLFALQAAHAQAGQQSDAAESGFLHASPDIYNDGPFTVDKFVVDSTSSPSSSLHHRWRGNDPKYDHSAKVKVADAPARPLLITTPTESGEYPVIVLQHGFSLKNSYYAELMHQVTSHGFVVVAPQMKVNYFSTDATKEIHAAGTVIDWLPNGLPAVLAQRASSVKANLSKLALVGHSRGGKVAFGVATGVYRPTLNFSGIAGLDPVDGTGKQSLPPILHYKEHDLKLGMPTLILGAALGCKKLCAPWPFGWLCSPPCAPKNVSHNEFYYESDHPAYHFVAQEYGHMDYMDDNLGILGSMIAFFCKSGPPPRKPMRRFAAGILVAFFQDCLLGNSSQLSDAFNNPSLAPVLQQTPEKYLQSEGMDCSIFNEEEKLA